MYVMQKDNTDNREYRVIKNLLFHIAFHLSDEPYSIWCAHVLTIKQVSYNYLDVICQLEKEFLLDYLKVRTEVVLGTAGSGALVWMCLLTKWFFSLSFVKILMAQSCALQHVMNHLSVFFTLMSCAGKGYVF